MTQTDRLVVQKKDGFLWIRLPDSITMDNYVKVEEDIGAALQGPSPRVVLDMGATAAIYSSGLGLIIRLRKRINEENGLLFLVNVSKKIRDMLEAVHLERLFTMYATDVEFEISQEDMLEKQMAHVCTGFVFISSRENGVFRINMSGCLAAGKDLSAISSFTPDSAVKNYVFDLTGLDTVDTAGIHVLAQLFVSIRDMGGTVVTYGGDEFVKDLMEILSLTEFVQCCENEREAMDTVGKG
jgi:anti-anti-sigma factor